jgi:hypothetical protein
MTEIPEVLPSPKSRKAGARKGHGPVMSSKHTRQRKYHPPPTGWVSWWPLAAGFALAFLSPMLRDFAAAYPPWGMRAVFPLSLLCGLPETGFSDELKRTLPQAMIFAQFPLEGLLTKFTLDRGVSVTRAVRQLLFIHAVCMLVLWLVTSVAHPAK